MKKLLILLLGVFFLISFASALDECKESEGCIGTFPITLNATIYQTCNNCTYCNFTNIRNNQNSQIIEVGEAIKSESDFTFVIDKGNFSENGIGKYQYNYDCGNEVESKTGTLWFLITNFGRTLTTAESFLYIILLIGTFIVAVFFGAIAVKMPYQNEINADGSITTISKSKYFKLLSAWFSVGFFMWFLQILSAISNNFLSIDSLANFITNILVYSGRLSLGFTMFILILLFYNAWKDILWSKTIRRHGKAFIDGRLS